MKRKDLSDLKLKTTKDLANKIKELRVGLTNLTLEHKMGKIKNVHEIKSKKRDIAKILTIMKLKSFEKPKDQETKGAAK